MTYYIINGSPRKNFNTSQLLDKATEGIKDIKEDAEIETINLYQLNYKGCMSCFSCKMIDGPFYASCPINDDLKELLPKLWQAEGIIFGSPVYFGNLSGEMRSFLERLLFPKFKYGEGQIIDKTIPIGFIVDMNVNPETGAQIYDTTIFEPLSAFIEKAFTKPEILKVYDTYQFNNYDLYENEIFSKEEKQKVKEEQFPKDLENAKKLGEKIAKQ